jgi:hypothetical protein
LYQDAILEQSTPTTRHRVLLSRGPNQYKLVVFSVFRVLVRNLRVLSLRFHLAEQLNHRDQHPRGLFRSLHLTVGAPGRGESWFFVQLDGFNQQRHLPGEYGGHRRQPPLTSALAPCRRNPPLQPSASSHGHLQPTDQDRFVDEIPPTHS